MKNFSLFFIVILLLSACKNMDITPAPTLTPTETPAPTATMIPTATMTLTPTYTPTPVVIQLDKPMTVKFDNLSVDSWPFLSEGKIKSGEAVPGIIQYLISNGDIKVNPDGSINPGSVIPAEPGQWRKRVQINQGEDTVNILSLLWPSDLQNPWPSDVQKETWPIQAANLLFKTEGGYLATEILYYKDSRGATQVVPLFIFFDANPTLPGNGAKLYMCFGHGSKAPANIRPFIAKDKVSTPIISLETVTNSQHYINEALVDMKAFFSRPDQSEKADFAMKLINGDVTPQGLGNFIWTGACGYYNTQ